MATFPDETESADDELRPEYDFRSMRGVVRGKYAERYRERLRVVRLADDVAEAFADEAAVNAHRSSIAAAVTNVPPGTYKLKAWHERLPADECEVTVPDCGATNVDFTLTIKNLPKY